MLDYLFTKNGKFDDYVSNCIVEIQDEIFHMEQSELATLSIDQIKNYFIEKYRIEVPNLRLEEKYQNPPRSVKMDAYGYYPFDSQYKPTKEPGIRYTLIIPYEGNGDLFHYETNPRPLIDNSSIPGFVDMENKEVTIIVDILERERDKFERYIELYFKQFQRSVQYLQVQIRNFNNYLTKLLSNEIPNKKQKIQANIESAKLLDFPIKVVKKESKIIKIFNQTITTLETIQDFKKNKVLILGQDTSEIKKLQIIKNKLEKIGYYGVIVKEIKDIEIQSVEEKVTMLGSLCRFIICENSVPSGHIDELKICTFNRFVTSILQEEGKGSTWMQEDYQLDHSFMKKFSYPNVGELEKTVDECVKWAEKKIIERQAFFNRLYEWRKENH